MMNGSDFHLHIASIKGVVRTVKKEIDVHCFWKRVVKSCTQFAKKYLT
jgi:hypothetical protein